MEQRPAPSCEHQFIVQRLAEVWPLQVPHNVTVMRARLSGMEQDAGNIVDVAPQRVHLPRLGVCRPTWSLQVLGLRISGRYEG